MVASMTKLGHVSRVDCPKCSTRSTFRSGAKLTGERSPAQAGVPYDRTHKYCKGQIIAHPSFGVGEVTAVIERQKIDVLFSDRIRRLVHESVLA